MVAEPEARRGGVATQAVKAMINFGIKEYKKNKILAKIKEDNIPSISLFEKLGFKKVNYFYYSYRHLFSLEIYLLLMKSIMSLDILM